MSIRAFAIAAVSAPLFLLGVSGTAAPSGPWLPDGAVDALAVSGSTVYAGGEFHGFWQPGPWDTLALYRGGNTRPYASFAAPGAGGVSTVVSDGAHGWFAGGSFTSLGGVQCPNLVHVLASGAVDPRWCPRPTAVSLLARSGRTLLLDTGVLRAVDIPSGRLLPWRAVPGASESIHPAIIWTLAADSRLVFLGGGLASVNGRPARRLAAVDIRNGRLAWAANVDGRVTGVAYADGRVYAVGFFRHVDGRPRTGVAALDATTGRLLDWSPVLPCHLAYYNGVAASRQRVFVSATGCGVSAVSTTTGARLWHSSVPAELGLSLEGNRLLTVSGHRVGVLAASTGRLLRWALESGHEVSSAARSGVGTAVGGLLFHPQGGLTRVGLAALDAATGSPTSWHAHLSTVERSAFDTAYGLDGVGALAADGNTIYAGGFGCKNKLGLAAFDAASGARLPFAPHAMLLDCLSPDWALAATSTAVYVASALKLANGEFRAMAAFDARTGDLLPWDPGLQGGGGRFALAVAGTSVYLGGAFTTLHGLQRPYLAAVDAVTGAPTTWEPRPDSVVTALAIANGILYVGGNFTHIGASARRGLAAFDLSTGALLPWDPGAGSDIYTITALAVSGPTVYVGGVFTRIGGADHDYIAAVDAASGRARAWSPDVEEVTSIAATPGAVYVGYRDWNGRGGLAAFAGAG
jgi:hypothetical protein